jgi:hypothetical protein
MNILIDLHHGALMRSLHHLFHRRYGHSVYLPLGENWCNTGGIYANYPAPIVKQMACDWIHHSEFKKIGIPLSYNEFVESNKIDVIIVTLWENYNKFKELLNRTGKRIKLILQVGNNLIGSILHESGVENLMSSAYSTYQMFKGNKIFYHQEFDTNHFKPVYTNRIIKSIGNFKNIMEDSEYELIDKLGKYLPDWDIKCYGINNRDGMLHDSESEMASKMNQYGFLFHVKNTDGYGHVIHNGFACGMPAIVNLKMAELDWCGEIIKTSSSFLFEPNITVIDYTLPINVIGDTLKYMADNYEAYSQGVHKKFKDNVDFDKDAEKVMKFVENVIGK